MAHFTHDELSALFSDDRRLNGRLTKEGPGSDVINRIIGYNRALSVRQTALLSNVRMVLN